MTVNDNSETKGTEWASISFRPTHGTATPIRMVSVLPKDKTEKEVFWVVQLAKNLKEIRDDIAEILPSVDDSHGGDDVIIKLVNGSKIGVQVTELTHELRKKRESIRGRYIANVLKRIQDSNISSSRDVVVKVIFKNNANIRVPDAATMAKTISDLMKTKSRQVEIDGNCTVVVIDVDQGSGICCSHINGIGFELDIDLLPRSISTYCAAIRAISSKKSKTRSQWLLVWSLEFWRDKHWLGNEIIDCMRSEFQKVPSVRKFFVESIDGGPANTASPFAVNLSIHEIVCA